jgi:hypothetical protein
MRSGLAGQETDPKEAAIRRVAESLDPGAGLTRGSEGALDPNFGKGVAGRWRADLEGDFKEIVTGYGRGRGGEPDDGVHGEDGCGQGQGGQKASQAQGRG